MANLITMRSARIALDLAIAELIEISHDETSIKPLVYIQREVSKAYESSAAAGETIAVKLWGL